MVSREPSLERKSSSRLCGDGAGRVHRSSHLESPVQAARRDHLLGGAIYFICDQRTFVLPAHNPDSAGISNVVEASFIVLRIRSITELCSGIYEHVSTQ